MERKETVNWRPESYDAWYRTLRGQWIGDAEFGLLMRLLHSKQGGTLLDVGCGTGYFSRRFRQSGLDVVGIDADLAMLRFATRWDGGIRYIPADALSLPFAEHFFDHCVAVTSLCFVSDPQRALAEMMRVARKSVVLGLLNRNSLLFRKKHDHGSYRNARWDRRSDVQRWACELGVQAKIRSAIFLPTGGSISRVVEYIVPGIAPFGGFLAAKIRVT